MEHLHILLLAVNLMCSGMVGAYACMLFFIIWKHVIHTHGNKDHQNQNEKEVRERERERERRMCFYLAWF